MRLDNFFWILWILSLLFSFSFSKLRLSQWLCISRREKATAPRSMIWRRSGVRGCGQAAGTPTIHQRLETVDLTCHRWPLPLRSALCFWCPEAEVGAGAMRTVTLTNGRNEKTWHWHIGSDMGKRWTEWTLCFAHKGKPITIIIVWQIATNYSTWLRSICTMHLLTNIWRIFVQRSCDDAFGSVRKTPRCYVWICLKWCHERYPMWTSSTVFVTSVFSTLKVWTQVIEALGRRIAGAIEETEKQGIELNFTLAF